MGASPIEVFALSIFYHSNVANPEEERKKEGNVWPVQGLCHIYFRGI
jgi:hypothetical protein